MSTADKLLEKIFSWIEQRELCAEKLNKAALDLESHRKNLNISECVGSTTAVAGAACMIGAGVATVLTGGAAAPLLGMAATVCSGAGVCLSVGTKITEHFLSSHTMKEVEKIEKKSKEIAQDIQKLLEQLREEKQRTISSANPDDLEQDIAAEILNAMARKILLQFQSITSTCDMKKQPEIHFYGKSGDMELTQKSVLIVSMMSILVVISTAVMLNSKIDLLLIKGVQGLIKKLSKTGLKKVVQGGAMVAGGAAVMVFELPEAIDTWKKLIDSNHVTEASKSIRKSAEELQKLNQQFYKLKRSVENEQLINLALKRCRDEAVKQWITEKTHSGDFDKLKDMFNFLKNHIDKEEKKDHGDHVHITFSAHGAITDPMIPAKCLLPLSNVEDVVLYSPWNCLILADAVYAVAAGIMKPQDRVFECSAEDGCKIPEEEHQPKNLPNHWNSMKEAGDKLVPNIILSPLKPEERDLETFESLKKNLGLPERNRILIPYDPPAGDKSLGDLPFYVVSLALSLVLLGRKFTATLHLPTCLEDQSAGKKLDKEYLESQYSYTIDHTVMTANTDIFKKMDLPPAAGDISKYCLCSSQ